MNILLKVNYRKKDKQIEALTKKQQEMESKFQQILEKIDTGRLS
jgi:hypothetical protein